MKTFSYKCSPCSSLSEILVHAENQYKEVVITRVRGMSRSVRL